MTDPTVSVVMSVLNGADYLGQAIESILSQSFRDFEFIVVDDGSTDQTAKILKDYMCGDRRVIILTNIHNRGLPYSLNRGLARARGKYVARQDSDDVSLPERLKKQVDWLERHPDVGVLGSQYAMINADGEHYGTSNLPTTDTEIRWHMLLANMFCHTSVMFRRALLKEIGASYDEAFLYAQDFDLWVRFLPHTSAANLEDVLVCSRRHQDTITVSRRAEQLAATRRIVRRQLVCLLPKSDLDDETIEALWESRLGHFRTGESLCTCCTLVRLFKIFEKKGSLDHQETALIIYQIVCNLLLSVGLRRALMSPALMMTLLRTAPLTLIKQITRQLARRASVILRI